MIECIQTKSLNEILTSIFSENIKDSVIDQYILNDLLLKEVLIILCLSDFEQD